MNKLIIHIGAHKTGSTAIQKFFYDFSEYFLDRFELYYPIEKQVAPNFGFWGQHYLTWYFSPTQKVSSNRESLNLAFNSFINIISERKYKNILISSEDFTWNNRLEEFVYNVKNYFDEIYVIMYVRRQVEASLSLYQTGVVNQGHTESFQEWFRSAYSLFDYFIIANNWKNAGCNVIVKPFIIDNFESKDVILNILGIISEIVGREIYPPNSYFPNSIRVNVSVPDFITMMIRFYNAQESKNKVVPVLRKLGLSLIEIMPGLPKLDFVPLSVKKEIIKSERESNRMLCEKYIGLEYLNWLNQDEEGDETNYNERFGYAGSQLVELSKAILNIFEEKLSECVKDQ